MVYVLSSLDPLKSLLSLWRTNTITDKLGGVKQSSDENFGKAGGEIEQIAPADIIIL